MGAVLLAVAPLWAAGQALPVLGEDGQQGFAQYQQAPGHKAFALAPGGAWGWQSGSDDAATAQDEALQNCQAHTPNRCRLYAVDQRVVWDPKTWPQSWAPYASAVAAQKASVGLLPGQRFPDLRWTDPQGRAQSVGQLKGQVLLVHAWGSWCPPCRRELPELASLQQAMSKERDLHFVALQTRESAEKAQSWAKAQHIGLPLSDSGTRSSADTTLHLADGRSLPDRELAASFPSTYVIDRQGVVVFAQAGSVPGWMQYQPLLLDVLRRSPR
jgi:thiol-disulfide isomerase/thioredoxin